MYYHAALLILCGNHLKNGIDLCMSSDLHLIRNSTLLSIQITINRDIRPEIGIEFLISLLIPFNKTQPKKNQLKQHFH